MTLTIGRGRGYVPAELNRGPEHTIGVIPIDSMFSPVRRVSYDVEAARVGQRTDYDKLRLDVTTDGSIDPRDAIGQAAEILIRQLAIFTDLEKIEGFGEAAARPTAAQAEPALAHGMENFPIEELELGVRSYNCLKRVGIETIGDLVTKTETELAAIPNFGKKSIEEVKETLAHARPRRSAAATERPGAAVRHRRPGKKLGRDSAHRKALYSNLAGALIEHGRIKTTVTKAKAVKPIAEQMITLGRRGDLHARRQATGVPALAGRRAQAVRRGRAALQGPARRLLADRQASARARATPPRWPTSSSSTRSTSRRSARRRSGVSGRRQAADDARTESVERGGRRRLAEESPKPAESRARQP